VRGEVLQKKSIAVGGLDESSLIRHGYLDFLLKNYVDGIVE
jgi:hypothetical protein